MEIILESKLDVKQAIDMAAAHLEAGEKKFFLDTRFGTIGIEATSKFNPFSPIFVRTWDNAADYSDWAYRERRQRVHYFISICYRKGQNNTLTKVLLTRALTNVMMLRLVNAEQIDFAYTDNMAYKLHYNMRHTDITASRLADLILERHQMITRSSTLNSVLRLYNDDQRLMEESLRRAMEKELDNVSQQSYKIVTWASSVNLPSYNLGDFYYEVLMTSLYILNLNNRPIFHFLSDDALAEFKNIPFAVHGYDLVYWLIEGCRAASRQQDMDQAREEIRHEILSEIADKAAKEQKEKDAAASDSATDPTEVNGELREYTAPEKEDDEEEDHW